MGERFTLPATITGSSWRNVWATLWEKPTRGTVTDTDGDVVPKWTNREAMSVIQAARRRSLFPLWYQFAAVALAWDPTSESGRGLDNSAATADQMYDVDTAALLKRELARIAGQMDAEMSGSDLRPELRLDGAVIDDGGVLKEVQKALAQDGAEATFKIPLPACRTSDGKLRGTPRRNPKTGKWECGPVLINDPVTEIWNKAKPWVVVLIAAAWFSRSRRSRRRK